MAELGKAEEKPWNKREKSPLGRWLWSLIPSHTAKTGRNGSIPSGWGNHFQCFYFFFTVKEARNHQSFSFAEWSQHFSKHPETLKCLRNWARLSLEAALRFRIIWTFLMQRVLTRTWKCTCNPEHGPFLSKCLQRHCRCHIAHLSPNGKYFPDIKLLRGRSTSRAITLERSRWCSANLCSMGLWENRTLRIRCGWSTLKSQSLVCLLNRGPKLNA